MSTPRDRAEAYERIISVWTWAQRYRLPIPYTLEITPGLRAKLDGELDDLRLWLSAMGDPPVMVAVRKRPLGEFLQVDASANLSFGRIEVLAMYSAPHLQPFDRRPGSLREARTLLCPRLAGSSSERIV